MNSVTVITLTRNRPGLLKRAVSSVQNQVCETSIRHFILVDNCEKTRDILTRWKTVPPNVKWWYVEREADEKSGPGRSAKLRNFGVRQADSPWISFLDDDNEFKTDHLGTLLACAGKTGHRMVHSHRSLYYRDGKPFLEERSPWYPDIDEGIQAYRELRQRGVFVPGSNVMRDIFDPLGTPDPIISVDISEVLMRRELLLEVPFPEAYSQSEGEQHTGEDDKLFWKLHSLGEPVSCTYEATLNYFLGGYSNEFTSDYDDSFSWSNM